MADPLRDDVALLVFSVEEYEMIRRGALQMWRTLPPAKE
jgi:hypothetical protein